MVHSRRVNGADVCSKSTNAIFKIIIDFPFLRDNFENRFLVKLFKDDNKKWNTKFCSKLISFPETG